MQTLRSLYWKGQILRDLFDPLELHPYWWGTLTNSSQSQVESDIGPLACHDTLVGQV